MSGKRRFGQFTLVDLLILITGVAAWTSYGVNYRRIDRLLKGTDSLQKTSGELVITDPKQFQSIGLMVPRYFDDAWKVYLPDGKNYQLQLATRGIQEKNIPEQKVAVPIAPGFHRI